MSAKAKNNQNEDTTGRVTRASKNAENQTDSGRAEPSDRDYEDRFNRLEGLMESMAATVTALAKKKRKKSKSKDSEEAPPAKKARKHKSGKGKKESQPAPSQEPIEFEQIQPPAESTLRADVTTPPASAVSVHSTSGHDVQHAPDVNKNDGWAAWLLANKPLGAEGQASHPATLPPVPQATWINNSRPK